MSVSDLTRTGLHNNRSPESLDTLMRMMAGHDMSHIDQIKRFLRKKIQLVQTFRNNFSKKHPE